MKNHLFMYYQVRCMHIVQTDQMLDIFNEYHYSVVSAAFISVEVYIR